MPTPTAARPQTAWPLAELSSTPLGHARARFFADNDFGADGGTDAPYQDAVLAGIPYRVPNGPARANALRRHDLHHLLTGYATHWLGEARISAWELGSGGPGPVLYAWTIALWGVFTGLVGDPAGTLRAFARGRGSRNLYRATVDEALLARPLDDVATELQVRAALPDGRVWHPSVPVQQRAADLLAFTGWSLAALTYVTAALPGILALAAAGVATQAWSWAAQPCTCSLRAA